MSDKIEPYLVELDAALSGGGATAEPAPRTEVPPLLKRGEDVASAKLQSALASMKAQVESARHAGEQLDFKSLGNLLETAEAKLNAIDPTETAPADAVAKGKTADANSAAAKFFAVVDTLNKVRTALNLEAMELKKQAEAKAAKEEEEALIQQQRDLSATKKKPAPQRSRPAAQDPAAEEGDDDDDDVANFPHKGKHRAPKKIKGVMVVGERGIVALTASKGAEALYFSRDPATVIALEADARNNGLTLRDGFTIVHRFPREIGADQGQATSCIRIDGNHGHPIVQSGSKQSFESYIETDLTTLATLYKTKKDEAIAAIKLIETYLVSINNTLAQFLPKRLPPGLKVDLQPK